jgi:hypothetical protein
MLYALRTVLRSEIHSTLVRSYHHTPLPVHFICFSVRCPHKRSIHHGQPSVILSLGSTADERNSLGRPGRQSYTLLSLVCVTYGCLRPRCEFLQLSRSVPLCLGHSSSSAVRIHPRTHLARGTERKQFPILEIRIRYPHALESPPPPNPLSCANQRQRYKKSRYLRVMLAKKYKLRSCLGPLHMPTLSKKLLALS